MAFRYPFRKIVDLKTSEKNQAEWSLADAIALLQKEKERLQEWTRERQLWENRIDGDSRQGIPVSDMQVIYEHLNYIQQRIDEQKLQVVLAEDKVAARKKKLGHKVMDEKIWTNAMDRAKWQYMLQVEKHEQDELDDIASSRFVRT